MRKKLSKATMKPVAKATVKAALKRMACCVLAAGMIFGGLPVNLYTGAQSVTVQAAWGDLTWGETNSQFSYEVNDDGVSATIIGWSGTDTKINIPEEIDGKKVTGIECNAFNSINCDVLTEITIPASVTSIPLTTLASFPAFSGCSSLTSIYVAENNQTYKSADGVLFNKAGTELLMYPDGKKGEYRVPDGVTSIESYAFSGCSNLTAITIPESVTSIGTFAGCDTLMQISVSENNQRYKSVDGVLYHLGKVYSEDFSEYSLRIRGVHTYPSGKEGTSYYVPDGVCWISDSAFNNCSSLTEIVMPDSVNDIGDWAFAGCISLTEAVIPEAVTKIGYGTFKNCSSLTEVTIPEKVTSIDKNAFEGCSSLEKITIPAGITNIGWYAFRGCSSLKEITIPEGITEIGYSMFQDCSSLNSIAIPEGVTEIMHDAFNGCRSITEITLPETLKSIDRDVFWNCSSLREIAIPAGVTSIGGLVFLGCSSLTKIVVAEENQNYRSVDGALLDKEGTMLIQCPGGKKGKYEIPEGVTAIGQCAFDSCSGLSSVTIPSGLTRIYSWTFEDCSSLTEITIPSSVTKIESYAFGFYRNPDDTDNTHPYLQYDNITVKGYKNTAAWKYANSYKLPFIALDEEVLGSGIIIQFPNDAAVSADTLSLTAKQLSAADKEYQNIIIADKIVDTAVNPANVKFTAYDITLKNSAGAAVQPKGNVTVKMPVPTGYEGAKCKVYYVNDKGEFVDMKAVYTGDYMIFETTHFSTYMITDTQMKAVEEQTVIYGDANKDGTVNSKDVVMMKKHLAGYTVDIDLSVCDVNGDNTVNSKDVVMVMKKLAGYDVVLGEK